MKGDRPDEQYFPGGWSVVDPVAGRRNSRNRDEVLACSPVDIPEWDTYHSPARIVQKRHTDKPDNCSKRRVRPPILHGIRPRTRRTDTRPAVGLRMKTSE